MSRSPLFDQLRRTLRLAAQCERLDISTAEAIERVEESQWSRRRFLRTTTAAAAGVALLPSLRPAMPTVAHRALASDPRIVIVGAGTAGLTCAYRLQQGGWSPRVLEGNTRTGGRMLTARGKLPEGQITELGGEFIDTDHDSLRNLASELGLALVDLRAADGDLQETYFFNKRRIPISEVLDGFRPVAAAIQDDLNLLTGDGDVTYDAPNNGEGLDRLSISGWFAKHNIGGTIRSLIEVAYINEYGLDPDQQSAFNLLFLIGTDDPTAFAIYGTSDERYHIVEGNDSVPTRLAAALQRPVEFGLRLEAIKQNSGGVYTLTFAQSGGKTTDIQADEVVLAIPFTMLRQVDLTKVDLPKVKRTAIQTLGYGTNAKVIAAFNARVWQQTGGQGTTYADLPYQSSWETTRGQAGVGGALTDYLGGARGLQVAQGTPEQRAAEFAKEIDQLFPGAAKAYTGTALRAHWPSEPFIKASYACYKPGQYSGIRGAESEAVGQLHFCGEHTSLESQGYMNGASESGERAAQEVLDEVGIVF